MMFAGNQILICSTSSGAELQQHPSHVQDMPETSRAQRLKEICQRPDRLIKHSKAVLHHPFDYIENGERTEYFSATVTGD